MTTIFILFGIFYLALAIPGAYIAIKYNLMRFAYGRCLPYLVFGLALIFVIEDWKVAVGALLAVHILELIAVALHFYDEEYVAFVKAVRKEWLDD